MSKMKNLCKEVMLGWHYSTDYSSMEPRIMAANMQGFATKKIVTDEYDPFLKKAVKKKKPDSLKEELEHNIQCLKQELNRLETSRDAVAAFEKQFKRGDVVFNKKTGPALFRKLVVFGHHMDFPEGLYEGDEKPNPGDLIVVLNTVNGDAFVASKDVVPYTESVRLLYEAERNNADE